MPSALGCKRLDRKRSKRSASSEPEPEPRDIRCVGDELSNATASFYDGEPCGEGERIVSQRGEGDSLRP